MYNLADQKRANATERHEPGALRLHVTGRVQGVGFRPFVYRIAKQCRLAGWVRNETGQVVIHAEGDANDLNRFLDALINDAPPVARPVLGAKIKTPFEKLQGFNILASFDGGAPDIHVPPDLFTCPDCLAEMTDPDERRYRYPFINCTQCGPRYTLIEALPYDRSNTTMKEFPLCARCEAEFKNPTDRRFHAQPLACPDCGPSLSLVGDGIETLEGDDALKASISALHEGAIVAVKGIGGYHLMCDAANDEAVLRLRDKKNRPGKPLAVMFPPGGGEGLDKVLREVECGEIAARTLLDPVRPIVLLGKRLNFSLSAHLSPGLNELGVFLPYSPLHHLLLDGFAGPLVATSGNISGEPVLTEPQEAEERLANIADSFLHHNRPIARPADDPVVRIIGGEARPIRMGRGYAPVEIDLPAKLSRPVLALGGHMKNTIALAWDRRCVMSPHIGDLDSLRGMDMFEQVIFDLQKLYSVEAETLICDAHATYASSKWARGQTLPVKEIQHHHAHASALTGEHPEIENWLIFTWDGVGFGLDDTLWGGEAFIGAPCRWGRAASFRPFEIAGGDKTGREPWRSAAALCWELDLPWSNSDHESDLAKQAWDRRLNTQASSAVGRLFDAAASLTLGFTHASYEGEGPMLLEAIASGQGTAVALPQYSDMEGLLRTDWEPLVPILMDGSRPASARAADFHISMARALIDQVRALKETHEFEAIGLSGGVFQNRILSEHVMSMLREMDMPVFMPRLVPTNDGGLAFGQVIEAVYDG